MTETFLIGRVALRFAGGAELDRRADLSAIAFDEEGNLWTASDETAALERLRTVAGGGFGKPKTFEVGAALALPHPPQEEEIDIEGMDVRDGALWLTGSHTSTRKRPKGKITRKALDRLAKVTPRPNRYVVARIPLSNGNPGKKAAHLPYSESGNSLTDALLSDPHFGPFLKLAGPDDDALQFASKENGFDIEGLALRGRRVFLGLRGPVLRGWAALLEIEPAPAGNGELTLQPIGPKGRPYRKHFLALGGMGLRDLAWHGERLLILAGPTMDITGRQSLWALKGKALEGESDTLTEADGKRLQVLFDLPEVVGADKAEGLARYDSLGEPGVLVAYDAPAAARQPDERTVYTDVFRLPGG